MPAKNLISATIGKTDFADGRKSKPSAKNLFADGHLKPSAKNSLPTAEPSAKKHRR
jgi:hypothetical protein